MLQIVSNHHHELKIADSKEMMVGIAYGMPFELEQFGLFNVSMHIDATVDTSKEGQPLVTVTSKDYYGHMFFVFSEPFSQVSRFFSKIFSQVNRLGHTSGCSKLSFQY
jgi:hypothetical protein